MEKNGLPPLDLERSIEHGVFVEAVNGYTASFNPTPELRYPSEPGVFTPFRFVIDFQMVPDDPQLPEPEISFRVYFTKSEIIGRHQIKLAKWRGHWEIIPTEQIRLLNHGFWAGYLLVQNYKLGDPPIALGE